MIDQRLNLKEVPQLSQRQDSVTDQLLDLKCVAQRLGMYDAAEFLQRHIEACQHRDRGLNTHPYVATPDIGWSSCSSCGLPKSNPIHRS